jgi:urease subunit alpha
LREIPRREYSELLGPTVGDRIRLADTVLEVEVEKDLLVHGDECVFGGGKTLRDGLGLTPGVTAEKGALDLLISNVVIIDPVMGIVKADIGIKEGMIAGVGKAGNPDTMDGVGGAMVASANTDVISAEGLLVTPGGIDIHVHHDSPQLAFEALSNGITTMIGGGLGPVSVGICSGGKWNVGRMLQHAEAIPVNFGFLAKGSSSKPESLAEQLSGGCIGFKIHEDWGAMPAVIGPCLDVADEYDVSVCLHTDTLNESGFVEDTIAAVGNRTIHSYHTEGAGGGHAPDIIRVAGEPNFLPSSTNPTRPYTVNTVDEHLDMIMVCHNLKAKIPEDVAFAESRIRAETIAAEDVLHDIGAISMIGSDSQGMGRVGETIVRTWQTAHKMKLERGQLKEEKRESDNYRVRRYIAKYTINNAISFGIDEYVGSLEPGKMADMVLWRPGFFGIKPEVILKGGFPVWAAAGESSASLMTCEPVIYKPQYGGFGKAVSALCANFVAKVAIEERVARKLGLSRMMLPVKNTRKLRKRDLLHNTACPKIEVNPETYEVMVDGELATSKPAKTLPLTQLYTLR